MDTEISYKYKDGYHSDIKIGNITCDKSIFQLYMGRYEKTENELVKRLYNCALLYRGDRAKIFLENLNAFCKNSSDYQEEVKPLYDFLIKQDVVEIIFDCY